MTLHNAILKAAERLLQAGVNEARRDAEVLLSHILQQDRAWIFTHIHDELDDQSEKLFDELVGRRRRREPLQYIVGRQEFWGLDFVVTPDVLIPRPETELVVEAAVDVLQGNTRPVIIDLCTGSGCIAVSLAGEFTGARIFATDRSGPALGIAGINARNHGAAERIGFLEGDLFGPIEELGLREQVDLITANPPYIPSREFPSLQAEVRDYEPEIALLAGPEGTEIHESIITRAPLFLKKDGALIMEMGIEQAKVLAEKVEANGNYQRPGIFRDLAGIERVIVAKRK